MIINYNKILNMHCDVYYYPAKFDIKIQLVYGETKRTNYIWGKMD